MEREKKGYAQETMFKLETENIRSRVALTTGLLNREIENDFIL